MNPRGFFLAMALSAAQPAPDPPAFAMTPDVGEPTPYIIDNSIIPRIRCGSYVGTGVYIGPGLIATARHVVTPGNCTADGKKAYIVELPGARQDFVLLRVGGPGPWRALIDCNGFHEGQSYIATGFAEGAMRSVSQILTGSNSHSRDAGFQGLAIFRGAVTEGMSGGPINRIDNGATVGIVNANTEGGATQVLGLAFADTPLCKKGGS